MIKFLRNPFIGHEIHTCHTPCGPGLKRKMTSPILMCLGRVLKLVVLPGRQFQRIERYSLTLASMAFPDPATRRSAILQSRVSWAHWYSLHPGIRHIWFLMCTQSHGYRTKLFNPIIPKTFERTRYSSSVEALHRVLTCTQRLYLVPYMLYPESETQLHYYALQIAPRTDSCCSYSCIMFGMYFFQPWKFKAENICDCFCEGWK